MTIQFEDRAVPYEVFVADVAAAVAALINADGAEFICQNEAFRRFGRRNVERWRKTGKIEPYVRPNKVEYRLTDLLRLKNIKQDYFA